MAGYRSFLNSLSHPSLMLVRIPPTNVELHLAGFRGDVTARANSEAVRRLALDHETFMRRPASGCCSNGASTSPCPQAGGTA